MVHIWKDRASLQGADRPTQECRSNDSLVDYLFAYALGNPLHSIIDSPPSSNHCGVACCNYWRSACNSFVYRHYWNLEEESDLLSLLKTGPKAENCRVEREG